MESRRRSLRCRLDLLLFLTRMGKGWFSLNRSILSQNGSGALPFPILLPLIQIIAYKAARTHGHARGTQLLSAPTGRTNPAPSAKKTMSYPACFYASRTAWHCATHTCRIYTRMPSAVGTQRWKPTLSCCSCDATLPDPRSSSPCRSPSDRTRSPRDEGPNQPSVVGSWGPSHYGA